MHAKHSPIFLEILALVVKDETDRGWSFCEPSLVRTLPALRASVRFTSVIWAGHNGHVVEKPATSKQKPDSSEVKKPNGQSAVHKPAKSRQLHSRMLVLKNSKHGKQILSSPNRLLHFLQL